MMRRAGTSMPKRSRYQPLMRSRRRSSPVAVVLGGAGSHGVRAASWTSGGAVVGLADVQEDHRLLGVGDFTGEGGRRFRALP